jgi:hypothetical protein
MLTYLLAKACSRDASRCTPLAKAPGEPGVLATALHPDGIVRYGREDSSEPRRHTVHSDHLQVHQHDV